MMIDKKKEFVINWFYLKILLYISFVITPSLGFCFLIETPLEDGRLIRGRLEKDEKLRFNGKQIIADEEGTFYFAVAQSSILPIEIDLQRTQVGVYENISLPFHLRKWPEEVINGLPSQKVSYSEKTQKLIQDEAALLQVKRKKFTQNIRPTCFIRPVKSYRLSGQFGARRILNGNKTSGHGGSDYAAPIGTEVYAPADGIVEVTHQNMYLTGKTILINHGYGLFSSYSHLSKILVKQGDTVRQGDLIGKVGQTGRATGPHLHFSFFWRETRVDPELVFTDFSCH